MAFKLKGKEEKFFSILEKHAALTYESAEMMERVFKGDRKSTRLNSSHKQ